MRRSLLTSCLLAAILGLGFPMCADAQGSSDTRMSSQEAIFAMLQKSAVDWNHGDLDTFATSYKDAPDILFIGKTISRGYAQMLATYRRTYSNPDKMGQLSFTQLEVQPLDRSFATVTGHFHLDRTPAAGGNADGYFLLVVENTANGWKIVRDDTTALPSPAATK